MSKWYEQTHPFARKELMVRQYYLHARKVSKTRCIYYVQFTDPVTKKRLSSLSTGKNTRDDALLVIAGWLKDGIPEQKGKIHREKEPCRSVEALINADQVLTALKQIDISAQDVVKIEKILKNRDLIMSIVKNDSEGAEPFIDYLRRFWDYDKSPYIADRHSHGISLGKGYAQTNKSRVNIYWAPYFQDKKIGEISHQDLKNFSIDLAQKHPKLSNTTLRLIMLVGTIAFRWAFANGIILSNPVLGLSGYSIKAKKRGVLSPKEAADLFNLKWDDNRVMLINLVAMTTGLRFGEIVGLKLENIGEKYLNIESSFSEKEGLKLTKTGEERVVPVIPEIRDAMIRLEKANPHGNGYIFWADRKDQPYLRAVANRQFTKMLIRLRVGENPSPEEQKEAKEYWKKRNVVFHSWRHFYASRMADKIEARKVMLATGHKTEAVFKGYADHALESDLMDVAITTGEVFGGLLPDISIA
jgi:integrase